MAYTKTTWKDLPDETTPVNATNMNKIENELSSLDTQVNTNTSNIATNKTNIATNTSDISNLKTYSTNEIQIGTWIDGKPLYRKVIYNEGTITYTNKKGIIPTGISNANLITKISGQCLDYYNGWFPLPYVNYASVDYQIGIAFNGSNVLIEQSVYDGRLTHYIIIIEYTKTTD